MNQIAKLAGNFNRAKASVGLKCDSPLLPTPNPEARLALRPARLPPREELLFMEGPLNGGFTLRFANSGTFKDPRRFPTLVRFGANELEPARCAKKRKRRDY